MNLLTRFRILAAYAAGVLTLTASLPSRAETIYAVDSSQVLSVDTVTRATTQLFDLSTWAPGGTPWSGLPNSLAYDDYTHNLIFSETNGSRIGVYNLLSSTASVLADVDNFSSVTDVVAGATVDGNMGGGAFFYNGSYYFGVEDVDGNGAEHSRLFRANLDATHSSVTSIGLVAFGGGNFWLGDFGDMAALGNGTVYGSSSSTGSPPDVMIGLWSFNVENPAAGFTTINAGLPLSQLAFSLDGSILYAHQFSAGNLGTIDLGTGTFTDNGALSGDATGLTDMSQAFSPVPEPSSALLLVAGIALLFRRRSDAVSRLKINR